MLDQLIQTYLHRFKAASENRRYGDTLKIGEEMKSQFKAHPPEASEVIRYLDSMAAGAPLPGSDLVFTAVWCNPSPEFQQVLCRILESGHASGSHEPVVELLAELGDAQAIPALKKALDYRWDYDEWLSVPRKSLQALRIIGTPEAIAIIQQATASSDTLIREEAKSLIESQI